MRNTNIRAWPSAAAAFVLLLIIAACGGGGAPATQAPAAATPAQPQATSAGAATNAPTDAPANEPTQAPPPAGSAVEACSLLTVEEVSTASGEPLDTAEPSGDDNYSNCTYSGDDDDFQVNTYVTKTADVASMMFNTMKVNDGEAVSGVGDEAWWSMDQFAPGLYIMKSGQLAYISGNQFEVEDSIVALGVLMASRM